MVRKIKVRKIVFKSDLINRSMKKYECLRLARLTRESSLRRSVRAEDSGQDLGQDSGCTRGPRHHCQRTGFPKEGAAFHLLGKREGCLMGNRRPWWFFEPLVVPFGRRYISLKNNIAVTSPC